uniref:Uncharacterized protein n=1 Tax=mine drainage metagenome TaxID=410659 RepID=E6PMC3_9ZZZZ
MQPVPCRDSPVALRRQPEYVLVQAMTRQHQQAAWLRWGADRPLTVFAHRPHRAVLPHLECS